MRHALSRRILVTAIALALAGGATAPTALVAAPADGIGVPGVHGSLGPDLLAQLRLWLSALWPWAGSGGNPAAVRRSPGTTRPQATCGMDPSGRQNCAPVTPQITCGSDPNGSQNCAPVTPQATCGADPDGRVLCSNG